MTEPRLTMLQGLAIKLAADLRIALEDAGTLEAEHVTVTATIRRPGEETFRLSLRFAYGEEEELDPDAPRFEFWECPDCQYSIVLPELSRSSVATCQICASDSGREVKMRRRPARPEDRPEGPDARAEEA